MTATKLKLSAFLIATGLLALTGMLAATQTGGDSSPPPEQKLGGTKGVAKTPEEKRPAVPVVRLARPEPGGVDRVARVAGTTEAVQQVRLFPKVAGTLGTVSVNIGDTVKAGQLLVKVDAPTLGLELRQATGGVAQAKGLLDEAEARLVTARAEVEAGKSAILQQEGQLNSAQATVQVRKKSVERTQTLVKQGTLSATSLDEVEEALRAAEAQATGVRAGVEGAKAEAEVKKGKLAQAEANVATARANVDVAMLAVEKAKLAVDQTEIRAPFDGVVTRRNGSVGDQVHPADRGDATPLLTIVRTDRVRVIVGVAGEDIPLVKPGVRAEVAFGSVVDKPAVVNQVARIGYEVDPRTQSMRVEVEIPNVRGEIRPGMYAMVRLTLGKGAADAVRVPANAIVQRVPTGGNKTVVGVYVYCNGKVRLTPVTVGTNDGDNAEILSGLTVEDRVVINAPGLPTGDEIVVEIEKTAPQK